MQKSIKFLIILFLTTTAVLYGMEDDEEEMFKTVLNDSRSVVPPHIFINYGKERAEVGQEQNKLDEDKKLYKKLEDHRVKQEEDVKIERADKKRMQVLCTIGYGIIGIGFVILALLLYNKSKEKRVQEKELQ